jgi:membrane protease YdiL (CAAX protease family)
MMLLGESLFLLVPLVFYGRHTISQNIAKIGNVKGVDRQGIFFMLAILSMMTLYLIFGYTSKRILPPNTGKYTFALVMGSFVMVFLGPFAEEVLFRGILFSEIISCYQLKPVYVILFQAALFYIVHLVVGGQFALTILFLGIIMGTFAFYTKSLFFGFIFHSLYNAVVVIMDIIDISGNKTLSLSGALLALLFFILSGLFLVFFAKHMRKLDAHRYPSQTPHDIPPAIRRK